MSPSQIEVATVDAFIAAEKRDRWHTKLAHPKKRREFLDRFNHHNDFDSRYATVLPRDADVINLLRERGAPKDCYVISDVSDLDGRTLPLEDAVGQAQAFVFGTLICCIPGELAFYRGEHGELCIILHRDREAASSR